MPGQLAEVFAEHWNLVAVRLPLSLPTSTIRLYWHRRSHEDQGNVWLRQLIVRELTDER
jgi:DNA-binding transcriptional LysR family regulator